MLRNVLYISQVSHIHTRSITLERSVNVTVTTTAAAHMEPTFLYPKARIFPFDKVCELIVRALRERKWKVPGIKLDFYYSESGAEKYCNLLHIKGRDFQLWFQRTQGYLEHNLEDTAAVSGIIIPGKELLVHDEHPGPSLYVYVGGNWADERERAKFMYATKTASKRKEYPRTYLVYGADWDDGWGRSEPWPLLLAHDNDLGREYDAEGDEPTYYRTDDVFKEVTEWLEGNLLPSILAHPIPSPSE